MKHFFITLICMMYDIYVKKYKNSYFKQSIDFYLTKFIAALKIRLYDNNVH